MLGLLVMLSEAEDIVDGHGSAESEVAVSLANSKQHATKRLIQHWIFLKQKWCAFLVLTTPQRSPKPRMA